MITHEGPWLAAGDKLVCFGDSITAPPDGYVRILQERLAPRGIEVVNAGRGGEKTPWALTRLETGVIQLKPTALSIFLGTNDARIGRGRWADEPTVPPEAYKCNLIWLMYLCRQAGIGKFSIMPPVCLEGEEWAEHGDILAPYCLAAREAADEAQARFVPGDVAFAEEWLRHPGHTGLLLTTDGAHLNGQGHRLVAETMLKAWGLAD
jgi:lysophospholipase L1-like esterase